MPGHSGVDIDGRLYKGAMSDITELSFSDKLISPHGIIEQSEDLMAKTCGAKKVLYLTSGGTGAVFIAISIARNFGGKIVTDRNAHKSVYAAARIHNLDVIQADIKEIPEIVAEEKGIAAVLITTPNYYGRVTPTDELYALLKEKGIIFIIDHCHGAHFVYSSGLPETCIPKADMTVCSLHKTLPVMTGGAMLAINREDLINYGLYYRMTLHSTSASYPILASIDFARAYMEINGEGLYDMLFRRVDLITDELRDTVYRVIENDDRTRLVIDCGGLSGFAVKAELESAGVYPEMADNSRVVFILTPFNADRISRLTAALNSINVTISSGEDIPVIVHERANSSGEIEFVKLEDSLDRVAVNEIGLYPPGTPLIISGDIIDAKTLQLLNANRNYIVGLVKGLVPVLK
jgi:arginine/lysine/ornithine decarboxylase